MDHDAIESILYEQGLKRLKKILPEGKGEIGSYRGKAKGH